jgi:hypothetical protein
MPVASGDSSIAVSLLGPFWIALQSVPNSCNLLRLMYRSAYYFGINS